MPLSPEQIAAAGPWAVLVAVLIAGTAGLWIAFITERIVPGSRLKREERRSRRLEAQLQRNRLSLEAMAKRLASRADRPALSSGEDPMGFHD